MGRIFAATVVVLALLATQPAPAAATSQSLVTIAVGTDLGVNRHAPTEGGTSRSFVSELEFRLRLVKVLGFAFAFNMVPAPDTGELAFTARYRMSALLYVVPTEYVSLYLTGGLGARAASDIFAVEGKTNTYHAGAGLEVYLGDHFALHFEYLWIIPGARSIEQSVTRRAVQDVSSTVDEAISDGAIPTEVVLPSISPGDYLSPGNFQINFGLRWYL